MSKLFTKTFLLSLTLLTVMTFRSYAQTSISGSVVDSNSKEVLLGVNILVKGKVLGTISRTDGTFSLNVSSPPPITLVFSMIGFTTVEIEISEANVQGLEVGLDESAIMGQEVVIAASRIEESIMQSPVAIEKMGILDVRNAAAPTFYDALANFKGVDMSVQSLTFKSINTRGFGANGNTRFVQLIDGIDNQAPGLNFSVGNVVGISDLDVESAELILGTASALYGPNALNGILLMNSKSPFDYQGLSATAKLGVTHADGRDDDPSLYKDFSIRYAKAFNNKFAFKVNASWLQAADYRAVDYRDRTNTETSQNDLEGNRALNRNYNGVNVYGNVTIPLGPTVDGVIAADPTTPLSAIRSLFPNDLITSRGWTESELIDNTTESLKLNAAFHYRINDNLEAFVQGNYGLGTTVYTANDRFVLDNFSIWTAKAELRGSNFYVRGYTTVENSGDTYAANTLGALINVRDGYFPNYISAFAGARTGQNPMTVDEAHAAAKGFADSQQIQIGTQAFDDLANSIKTTPISEGGAKFLDKSSMLHFEGMYNFTEMLGNSVELIAGGNYRIYNLKSEGTLFALDENGDEISYAEFGGFVQASKAFVDDKLKLAASLRFDKNENFAGQFAPRLSAVFSPSLNHNFRVSYQKGYRNPTAQDQFIDLDVSVRRLIGSNPLLVDRYNFETNSVYSTQDIDAVRNGDLTMAEINPVEFKEFKTEKITTYEVGYKGLIAENLYFDAYYYYSSYKDFIAEIRFVQATPTAGDPPAGAGTASNPSIPNSGPSNLPGIIDGTALTQEFGFDVNADGNVTSQGWAVGLEYNLGGGYNLGGNVSYNQLISQQDLLDQGFRASYNTPEWRLNGTFGNRRVTDNVGFNVAVRWQDAFLWESAYGIGVVPAFLTVDAQVSYKVPSIKSIFKLGGSNIFNQRYTTSFGNPSIGSLYYVSITFDEFLN